VLEPDLDERECGHCGRYTYVYKYKKRRLKALGDPLFMVKLITCCPDRSCPGHAEKAKTKEEMSISPPCWTVTWELFAWMGHRRLARHWSVPQIRAELFDTYGVEVSPDLIEDYTAKYEVMVAARESDIELLVASYREVSYLELSIDGLQPEKGHETLYVVRELTQQRVWFATPLLSSAAKEVHRLIERAREIAERIGKPVRCWTSDKQDAFVTGVAKIFPEVPHRYCQNHFLRDAAEQTQKLDSQAKVQMRRKVRGLRGIERKMLTTQAQSQQTTAAARSDDEPEQVVLDYCATVRGILNDNQGGPLDPPGLRMAKGLDEVRDSIDRVTAAEDEEKKTTPVSGRSAPLPIT